jgi:hypothetical protein
MSHPNITGNENWSVNANDRVLFHYDRHLSDVHGVVFASNCQTSNQARQTELKFK